ncbi:winged helix DNA-binding protein [Aquihabitans sp. G128]|uniref:helix-turn-helix transcriptional regulator n=1 Tax=Aquihabitans sp. G128 TaxID=2849779 RepID=UPI001C23F5FE|nr:helix-turn-helix domain-containing protein [Aquihabitans sp. G128]QXC61083.1 winged helix DNA-binding protein [Aquihabitans sp. G128]
MSSWSFLTNHGRAILFIQENPDARLRDLGAALEVTERTAFGIVADLTEAGYVVKERDGRRNRYHLQDHLPLNDPLVPERTVGQLLELLTDTRDHRHDRRKGDRPLAS